MSSKPLVNALATAAAPDLRAWVRSNAEEVEGVVDAALEVPDDVQPVVGEPEEEVFTPLAFGDVADLAEDGLTSEQRKRALSWLDKRAHYGEGEFDAEEAHLALSLLPGWSSEVLTTLRAVPMNRTTADGSFPAALVEAGFTHVPVPGNRAPFVGDGHSSSPNARKSNIEGVSYATRYGDAEESLFVTPEIAATFREFDPKKTKVKDLPAGRWAARISMGVGDAVLTKPVLVFAEQGGLRVTNTKGETATVTGGKSGWKALYGDRKWELGKGSWTVGGLGLAEAASAVVDALTRKVKAREAFEAANKKAWGGALCPVCFQRAAVTPTSNHMVDHRHMRPGWGYNVKPCEGNRYAPYKDSPAGSEAVLGGLEAHLPRMIEELRAVLAHPEKQAYPVNVYVRDERGEIVYDLVPPHLAKYRNEKKARTQQVIVRQGHRLFPERYAKDVAGRKGSIRATANAIPFYAAAVRVWRRGLDNMEPIEAAARTEVAPALPRDLFPSG